MGEFRSVAALGFALLVLAPAPAPVGAAEDAAAWVAALESRDAQERKRAAQSLAAAPALAGPALPALVELLAAERAETRAAALRVLEALGPAAGPALPRLVVLLDAPDASFAARTGATRALIAIGPAAVPETLPRFRRALAAVELTPASARYRVALVRGIGEQAGAADAALGEYTALLERGLRSERSWIRVEAARSLAAIGPAAQPALAGLRSSLRGDRDRAVRALAAEALGAIGPAARPALPELRAAREQDPNARVRSKARHAITAIESASSGHVP